MAQHDSSQIGAFAVIYGSYAISLIVKRSFSFALPDFGKAFGIANTGAAGASWELANGVAKVGGGVFVDLLSPSLVLAAALGAQGITAALFLLPFVLLPEKHPSSLFAVSAALWGLNGFAQAFMWPALARIFLSWFPDPKQRGLWYTILATSQNVGAGVAPILTASAVAAYGWQARLYGPAAVAVAYAVFTYVCLTDAPAHTHAEGAQGIAFATVPPTKSEASKHGPKFAQAVSQPFSLRVADAIASIASMLSRVLSSRTLWLLGVNYCANSFVRNAFTTFFPLLVEGPGGIAPGSAGMAASANLAYEIGGGLGGLLSGVVSDKVFGSRRVPVMALFSLALAPLPLLLTLPILWSSTSITAVFFAIGLTAFPPHVLNGLVARELAPQDAVSSAGGFTKSLGQVGAAFADAWVLRIATGHAFSALFNAWGVGMSTTGTGRVEIDGSKASNEIGLGLGWISVMWLLSTVSFTSGLVLLPLWDALPVPSMLEGISAAPASSGGTKRKPKAK